MKEGNIMAINSIGSSSQYQSPDNYDKTQLKSIPLEAPVSLSGGIGCLEIDPATGKVVEKPLHFDTFESAHLDKNKIYVEPCTYEHNTDNGEIDLGLYNSKGEIAGKNSFSDKFLNDGSNPDPEQTILQDVDPSFPVNNPLTVQIPKNGETLAEYDKQWDVLQPENEKMENEYQTALHKYDGYSTPIADSMMSYLGTLQNASSSCGGGMYTYNLEAVPGGDGNYLAESVTAYEKAKTEIEDTYSSDNIAQRAKSQGITDIDTYTKQQQASKNAELQKLNLDYAQETGSNITTQANGLNKFFNYSNWDGDNNSRDIGTSLVNMEKQLFSAYGQFAQQNNIDYSSENIQDIAKKFQVYASNKVTATINIDNTDFTYKDIVSAAEVLGDARINSYEFEGTIGAYHAALGASEVAYVAKHNMTNAAGQLLSDTYNNHLQYQENMSHDQLYSSYYEMKNLNTYSVESFKNSFNNLVENTFDDGYANIYGTQLQDVLNSFVKHFLN